MRLGKRGAAVVVAYLIHYLHSYLIPILGWRYKIFYYEHQTSHNFDPVATNERCFKVLNPCLYPFVASYEIQTSDYQNFEICVLKKLYS